MRKLLLGVLCLVVSSSLLAQRVASGRVYAQPTVIEGVKIDPIAMFKQYKAQRSVLVSSDGPDNAFLFAVVGSAPGSNGTYFRSEVTLVNNDTVFSQPVAALYFPANGGNCGAPMAQILSLRPNSLVVYNDFVNQVFNTTGLGGLVILGSDSSGNFDSTANIDGFSRIWTPIAGFQGTASQSFQSEAISGYPGSQFIYGIRSDSSFRTNLFVFNYYPTLTQPRTFGLNFAGDNGNTGSASLTVAPCSLGVYAVQGNYGSTAVSITPPDSLGGWFAFGSSNDNLSGDNWSVGARPDLIH